MASDVVAHRVPVGADGWLHLRETVPARPRAEPRAALLMSGPVGSGADLWSVPFAGYDGSEVLADLGVHAFAVDWFGTGGSSRPADGRTVHPLAHVEPLREVLDLVRRLRGVERVDLVAESVGGGVATQLAADSSRVRSCTVSTVMYRTLSPLGAAMFTADEWAAQLDAAPDGYLHAPADMFDGVLGRAPAEVLAWARRTQPGGYPVGTLSVPLHGLPYFDPGVARVPGQVLVGRHDVVPAEHDPADLAADYGPGGARLVVFEDGGHIPRLEAATATAYWTHVEELLEL